MKEFKYVKGIAQPSVLIFPSSSILPRKKEIHKASELDFQVQEEKPAGTWSHALQLEISLEVSPSK